MTRKFRVLTELFGEVILEPRGQRGIYSVSFYFKRRHHRRTLKTTNRQAAIEKLPTVLKEFEVIESRRWNGTDLELAAGLELYLEHLADKNRPPKTIQQVKLRINAFIEHMASWGIKKFSGVEPRHADSFYREMRRRVSHNSACGYIRFVKSMYRYLASRQYISEKPFDDVNFARDEPVRTPKPTLEQVNLILSLMESRYLAPVSALAMLGCRADELTRVQKRDVNLNEGTVEFKKPEYSSKTVPRIVPIHPRLLAIMQGYSRRRTKYFFCTQPSVRSKGGKKIKTEYLNDSFQDAVKKAGLPAGRSERGFVAHSLRGFFKSHAILSGIPREVVDYWQGHRSDGSVGTRHYFDLPLDKSIELMNSIDFGSI